MDIYTRAYNNYYPSAGPSTARIPGEKVTRLVSTESKIVLNDEIYNEFVDQN